MSGLKSRRKGARVELETVHYLQDRGIAAKKISGMYKPGADLSVPIAGRDLAVEVKSRAKRISIEAAQYRTLRHIFRSDPEIGPKTIKLLRDIFASERDDAAAFLH